MIRHTTHRTTRLALQWLFLLVAGSGALAQSTTAAPAKAAKPNQSDARAIEKVIRDQIDAFGRDDAKRAFAHAAPDIRRMFGTPDDFMRMVRDGYAPVYRASSIFFLKLETIEGFTLQTVQLVDSEGRVWIARFAMRQQPDKSWKVAGCELVATRSLAT